MEFVFKSETRIEKPTRTREFVIVEDISYCDEAMKKVVDMFYRDINGIKVTYNSATITVEEPI